METLRFDTLVRKNGVLKIPALENYVDQNVEVIVVVKGQNQIPTAKNDISTFLEKWTGFFEDITTDDIKYNYLMEKHK